MARSGSSDVATAMASPKHLEARAKSPSPYAFEPRAFADAAATCRASSTSSSAGGIAHDTRARADAEIRDDARREKRVGFDTFFRSTGEAVFLGRENGSPRVFGASGHVFLLALLPPPPASPRPHAAPPRSRTGWALPTPRASGWAWSPGPSVEAQLEHGGVPRHVRAPRRRRDAVRRVLVHEQHAPRRGADEHAGSRSRVQHQRFGVLLRGPRFGPVQVHQRGDEERPTTLRSRTNRNARRTGAVGVTIEGPCRGAT